MRAGYVVSGVVFLSLATIFGLVAMVLGVFYGITNAGALCAPGGAASPADIAVCNAYTAGTIITSVASIAFYAVSILFLWTGFKTMTAAHVVTVMQPMVTTCPSCKAQVGPGQRFCANCGARLD